MNIVNNVGGGEVMLRWDGFGEVRRVRRGEKGAEGEVVVAAGVLRGQITNKTTGKKARGRIPK